MFSSTAWRMGTGTGLMKEPITEEHTEGPGIALALAVVKLLCLPVLVTAAMPLFCYAAGAFELQQSLLCMCGAVQAGLLLKAMQLLYMA